VKEMENIRDLGKSGGLSEEMLDILRVLTLNQGVNWKSELIQDLSDLRSFKGEGPLDKNLLEKALKALENKKLLKIEKRMKGSMSKAAEDEFISLLDFQVTKAKLASDSIIVRYMYQRSQTVSRKSEG
jgi:hypothetical protein